MKLFFSNRIEALAERLSDYVFAPAADPFLCPMVLLPNPNLEKWLKLQWSEQFGCVAGINFISFEAGLFQLLREFHVSGENIILLEEPLRRIIVANLLERCFANGEDAEEQAGESAGVLQRVFSDYVLGYGRKKGGTEFYLRIQQLAGKLSGLFREYEYHRPEMMADWIDGNSWLSETPAAEMESAQMTLYRDFKTCYSSLEPLLRHNLFSLFQELTTDKENIIEKPAMTEERIVHIFAISQVSALHMRILEFLGELSEIYIYCLNPCCEYWEDVRSAAEMRWQRRKTKNFYQNPTADEEVLPGAELLSLWGRAGRENIRNLCSLTDYDVEDGYFAWSEPCNNLFNIQNSLLTLSGMPENKGLGPDDSFCIIKASSRRDEIAFIARSIRAEMAANPDLKLNQIAVLLPDVNVYRHLIELEFMQSDDPLIYNMIDSAAGQESIYGLFINSFFALCAGEFTRKEVFSLLGNALVRQKWDITGEELLTWSDWCEKLGIFRFYEKNASGGRAFTWKQGLQRLRLSIIAEERPMTVYDDGFADLPPWRDLSVDEDSLEKFSRLLELLYLQTQRALSLKDSALSWRNYLDELEQNLILFSVTDGGEKTVADNLKKGLDFMNLLNPSEVGVLDYRAIRAFFAANIRELSGGTGEYLVHGVCISALLPMRPIPFRIIYVAGLEDAAFPGRSDRTVLDLRLTPIEKQGATSIPRHILKRRDITRPERNQWLFLESLVCAREKLFLCYTGFDPMKDREVLPSAVINQLQRWLSLYASEEIGVQKDAGSGLPTSAEKSVDKPNIPLPEERKQVVLQPGAKISIRELARFLADPVAASQRLFLRSNYEEDTLEEFMEREDEPFLSEFPHGYNLQIGTQKEVLHELMKMADRYCENGGRDKIRAELCRYSEVLPETFYRRYTKLARRSLLPDTAYAGFDADSYRDFLYFQKEVLDRDELNDFLVSGKRSRNSRLELRLSESIVLSASAEFLCREGNFIRQLVVTGSRKYNLRYQVFEALLFFICTAISDTDSQSGDGSQLAYEALFFYRDELRIRRFNWPANLTITAATEWLKKLVNDYCGVDNHGSPRLKLFKEPLPTREMILESFYDYEEDWEADWLVRHFYRPLDREGAEELFERRYALLWEICPELWSNK